jgi:D-alanyl-D-alanine carboxypeptidase/D-alanyl-D-alanine-endopeptidase (penicillin-binding protein 4)
MAKTGYVGFVRTLSGFVETEDNQTLIFTFMVNNFTTSTSVINELQDSIISIISSKTMNELLSH